MTTAFAWPDHQHPSTAPGPSGTARPATPQRVGLRSPRSWSELVYALIDLVPSILFFVLPVTLLAVGLGLAVIYVGVPLLALGLLVARFGGLVQRTTALALLGLPSTPPGWRAPRRPGPISALTAVLRDAAGWRALGYFVIKLALAPVTFAVAVAVYAAGLGALAYPIWHGYLPEQAASDGSLHRGMQWWPDFFVDSWTSMAVVVLIGAGVLWCAPRVVGFLTTIDRMLIVTLLSAQDRGR
jgi:hypothetical protein